MWHTRNVRPAYLPYSSYPCPGGFGAVSTMLDYNYDYFFFGKYLGLPSLGVYIHQGLCVALEGDRKDGA